MILLGYRDIKPAFYETTLKGKVARDDVSVRMLDMVFEAPILDIGIVFDIATFPSNVMYRTNQRKLEIASYTESQRKSIEKAIDNLNEHFKGN